MNYEIGVARSVQIEWQYGLTALADMISIELPRHFRPYVSEGFADWSERYNTGRVLQLTLGDFDNLGSRPRYVRPGRSMMESVWLQKRGTVRQESIGHPTLLNQRGEVVQNEVYVDRWVELTWFSPQSSHPHPELLFNEFTHHVSETSSVELVPFSFEVPRGERANTLATNIGHQMYVDGYRGATLTETLWYAAKYQDEIGENQFLVPWAGYSGGFSEGRQLRHHQGIPFVVRRNGVLRLSIKEFLGQHMPVQDEVKYLAVKI